MFLCMYVCAHVHEHVFLGEEKEHLKEPFQYPNHGCLEVNDSFN